MGRPAALKQPDPHAWALNSLSAKAKKTWYISITLITLSVIAMFCACFFAGTSLSSSLYTATIVYTAPNVAAWITNTRNQTVTEADVNSSGFKLTNWTISSTPTTAYSQSLHSYAMPDTHGRRSYIE